MFKFKKVIASILAIIINNHGCDVYIEMTWVLAFDITPQ
jgi:hypothetical protein